MCYRGEMKFFGGLSLSFSHRESERVSETALAKHNRTVQRQIVVITSLLYHTVHLALNMHDDVEITIQYSAGGSTQQ